MDFRELVYITTLADTGNVTAAAKKLYMSQPALSQILAKTEQELGVKLFNRNRNPLTLTYAGERYVDTAKKILTLNENLRRELVDICNGDSGEIRMGIPRERAGYMLPPVLKEFQKQYPKVRVRIFEDKVGNLLEALEKGDVNFLVVPRARENLPLGTKAELIYREPLYVIANQEMILPEMLDPCNADTVVLEKMEKLPLIIHTKGQEIRKQMERVLKRHGINPSVIMETSSVISAVMMAASGYGFTIAPLRAVEIVRGNKDLRCYHYEAVPDSWEVNVIYREDGYIDHIERSLIDMMKQRFASYPLG